MRKKEVQHIGQQNKIKPFDQLIKLEEHVVPTKVHAGLDINILDSFEVWIL